VTHPAQNWRGDADPLTWPAAGADVRRMQSRSPRPRHEVHHAALLLLRPVFRYSRFRDAYVLRGVGNRMGPVLTERW
jgi:hypothetical protein